MSKSIPDETPSVTDLNDSQQAILARLHEADSDELTGGEIATSLEEMSTDNANWHLRENLEPWGLVQKVGTRDEGTPIPANLWMLTDDGRRLAQDCSIPPTHEDLAKRVRELEKRVDEHDSRFEKIREKMNELVDLVQR